MFFSDEESSKIDSPNTSYTFESSKDWERGKVLSSLSRKEISVDEAKWEVFFYSDFVDLIDDNEVFCAEVLTFLTLAKKQNKSFRVQVTLKSVPLLLAIFPRENRIYLAGQKLSYELFAIKNLEKIEISQRRELMSDESYEEFKKFVQEIAALNPMDFPSVIEEVTLRYQLADPFEDEQMIKTQELSAPLIEDILKYTNEYRSSLFEKVSDFALGLTAQFALIRIHLLKFLAILPSLDHDKSGDVVKRMLQEALRRLLDDHTKAKELGKKGDERPLPRKYEWAFAFALMFIKMIPPRPLAFLVRSSVRTMAKRFIAGETIEEAKDAFSSLYSTKRDVTVDQLGELVVSEKEADQYKMEVLKLIRGFHLHVPRGEKNSAGVHRAHISIKVSALCSDFRPQAFDYTYQLVAPRLIEILTVAKEHDVFINIDAEHYDYRDIVFEVYRKVLLETAELKDYAATGIVVQAYLRDATQHLRDIFSLAKSRGICMPIRLVKGAYWDAETIDADAHGHLAPEFLNKEETDLHFRQLVIEILKHGDFLQLCLASHNFSDHAFAQALRSHFYPQAPAIEHQCLHMTYEALSVALSKMGWPVRNYVPIGSLLVGMAYLVRRIMENSSQVGVLTIMRSHKKRVHLSTPDQIHMKKKASGQRAQDQSSTVLSDQFVNLTPVRTYLHSERKWVEAAYKKFSSEGLGKFYKASEQQAFSSSVKHQVFSSSNPEILVGEIDFANAQSAKKSIDQICEAYQKGSWSHLSYAARALILCRAALIMSAKRNELSALISYEAGKAIDEALADVDEAVDFLNFYARQEVRLHRHNPDIISRGACAVIAPWNFPLAIPCGMTVATLVAGNTVILKSAEQTPLIAQRLCEILWQAGIPKDSLVHLPGMGEEVGQALVEDKRLAQITFTGSKNIGMMIHEKAAHRMVQNPLYKVTYPSKVITEMGGKNAIIVTSNAELDETVAGILYSSFAHAGQKCSAASRVIVHNSIKAKLIERLAKAVQDLKVGEAYDFSTAVNPVISKEDRDRLVRQVKEAAQEAKEYNGRVIVDRSDEEGLPGYCVGPAVIELPVSRALSKNSYASRELFGPVVHIIGVNDLDEALKLFNATEYALTGGIFSQSQDDIDYLSAKMECGNLYVNRTITGARVAIEPFGGFKLSGTGPKAGGRQYLASFHVNPFDGTVPMGEPAPEDGEGSEYDFDFCRPSGLSTSMRCARMVTALDEMVQHFEALYQGLYIDNKDVLVRFRKWVGRDFIDFHTRRHWNRRIPGQLSYSDISLCSPKALVISFEKRPYFSSLMQVLSAVLMGTGVTVMTRNQYAYRWWGQFKNLLARSGFSKENFDVYFVTESMLAKKLSEPDLSTIIIDGAQKHVEYILDLCSEVNGENKEQMLSMRLYLSAFDCPHNEDFKALCQQFAWTRAFAINTIRHGAPLELQLEGR